MTTRPSIFHVTGMMKVYEEGRSGGAIYPLSWVMGNSREAWLPE
jgi:hypothetical protein